jgi:hypothetical protein
VGTDIRSKGPHSPDGEAEQLGLGKGFDDPARQPAMSLPVPQKCFCRQNRILSQRRHGKLCEDGEAGA